MGSAGNGLSAIFGVILSYHHDQVYKVLFVHIMQWLHASQCLQHLYPCARRRLSALRLQ